MQKPQLRFSASLGGDIFSRHSKKATPFLWVYLFGEIPGVLPLLLTSSLQRARYICTEDKNNGKTTTGPPYFTVHTVYSDRNWHKSQ